MNTWVSLASARAFNKTRSGRQRVAVVAGLAALGFAGTGNCLANLNINVTFDSTITNDPNAPEIESSIDDVVSRVEAAITNNVTDSVTFAEMSSGLGESSSAYYVVPYSTYYNALVNNQTLSANDVTAIASLGGPSSTNPVNGNTDVNVATTLARALNIANNSGSDGTIYLNTSIMNLSRTGPQNSNFYDIEAVAAHELDEVLGTGGLGSALEAGGSTTGSVGVLDLFRYSAPGVRSYTVTPGGSPYFSINGGVTDLVHFNASGMGDYGDWGNNSNPSAEEGNNPPQVQDAFGSPGVDVNIGANELTALDVVGYNIAVPEPATLGLATMALMGLVSRRRRR